MSNIGLFRYTVQTYIMDLGSNQYIEFTVTWVVIDSIRASGRSVLRSIKGEEGT